MEINGQITVDEISRSVKDSKIEKTCYDDNIINEYIKSSAHLLIPIYTRLFNCILIPGIWLSWNSIPIFKNKGKSSDPKNNRLISILSCLGKLFTSMLNKRLNVDSNEFVLINQRQVDFRLNKSKYNFFALIIWTYNLEKEKNGLCIHEFW